MENQISIKNEEELIFWMTQPSQELIESIRELESPLVILGAGGKMGPSLALLARNAADAADHQLEIIAVSRFSNPKTVDQLKTSGIQTISADLMNTDDYQKLPQSKNIVYLVGLKFGTANNPAMTWATNTLIPYFCLRHYAGAKIVALSSGNVYPFTLTDGPGSREDDPLNPLGEYANSCVARERIFEYYANQYGNPIALIRLSYAVDLRYGVLVDIARKVLDGEPIDLTTGALNCIWQGDANDMILRSIAYTRLPPMVLNLTGLERHSVRELALKFGAIFKKEPVFLKNESGTALISNTARMVSTLGSPKTKMEDLIAVTADWIEADGLTYNKSTHFEVRNGDY